RLHAHLFERAIAAATQVADAHLSIVTTGDLDEVRRVALSHVPEHRLTVRAQRGSNAGERLLDAVRGEFVAGPDRVVVIGSDTPELEAEHLHRAVAALDGRDGDRAVMGPSRDGGYYLLGLSRFSAAPFCEIRFGSHDVGAITRGALERDGFAVSTLEELADL